MFYSLRESLTSVDILPRWLEWSELGWSDSRILELLPGLPHWSRGPQTWAILHWFLRHIARRWIGSGIAGTRIGTHRRCWCCKWGLNLLCHGISLIVIFVEGCVFISLQSSFIPDRISFSLYSKAINYFWSILTIIKIDNTNAHKTACYERNTLSL